MALLLIITNVISCQRPSENTNHQVTIKIPTASEFQKSGPMKTRSLQMTIPYELLCFAVNAKGSNLPSLPAQTCGIEKGLTAGSVSPGESLSFNLKTNQVVQFELYGFLRNSPKESCPNLTSSEWFWPVNKTYELGKSNDIKIEGAETRVEFNLILPKDDQNIAVQKSWPPSCLSSFPSFGVIPSSSGQLTGSSHRLYLRETSLSSINNLKGQRFQFKGWTPQ